MPEPAYKEISKRKIAERDAKFKPEWLVPEDKLPGPEVKDVHLWPVESGYLSAAEIEITQCNPMVILQKIKDREWTAVEVYKAFAHRATIAHQLINCLTEVFFDEGLKTAQELDEYYATTGKLKGPLHGLPVSLKDNQPVHGIPSSMGYTCLADELSDSESLIARSLRSLGAVFYVKTNLPTAMMMPDSVNYLWGATSNPFNRDLTCGGSSGGEGALVAMRGSVFGIGGDIGGSLRVPAAFQGLYTIKTTSGRWPVWGGKAVMSGCDSVPSVNGPIATSVDILEMYGKLITSMGLEDEDPRVIPFGWRDVELPEKLTFAVCYEDDMVRPQPPVLRGMKLAVEKLKAAGHEVIEWDPQGLHSRLHDLVNEFFTSGGADKIKALSDKTGEPLENIYIRIFVEAQEIPVSELWSKHAERTGLVKEFIDRWVATASKTSTGKQIDGLLIPVSPYPGAQHGEKKYLAYTSVFNGLDWPSGVVPVTRADKAVDLKDMDYMPKNEWDKKVYDAYDPEVYHGGPVAIQVVGRKLQDEKVLKMMKVVAQCIGTDDIWFK